MLKIIATTIMNMMKKIEFDSAFMYHYNPREGTKAYSCPGRIDEKLKILQDERTASAKEVLEFLTKSMRGELDEEIVVVEGTGDGTSEARKIKKQIGLRERIKSAELLGKRYRLFTDKVEVEGVVPVMIVGESELEE